MEVHPLDFSTNRGKLRFYCWDTAGQEKFGGAHVDDVFRMYHALCYLLHLPMNSRTV